MHEVGRSGSWLKGAILQDLKRARRSGKPVRVDREIDCADRLDAYVVGIGRKWVLLHTISNELRLDGPTRSYVSVTSSARRVRAGRAQP
ncbi:hypothetical protein GCM10018952_52700 [Streptosporangium vulgare]